MVHSIPSSQDCSEIECCSVQTAHEPVSIRSEEQKKGFNRSWRISTTPNTTKIFLIIFKLIQQSNIVILSCLVKKNQNLNLRKKKSVYYWKLRFQGRNACKLPFLVINWTFFPQIQISIFLREATQNDHIRLLYKFETEHFFFGCVGSCGYAAASVK